jgi:hypothetical protein
MRQALVNNQFFAQLAVGYDLHKYLKYESVDMFNQITKYTRSKL